MCMSILSCQEADAGGVAEMAAKPETAVQNNISAFVSMKPFDVSDKLLDDFQLHVATKSGILRQNMIFS